MANFSSSPATAKDWSRACMAHEASKEAKGPRHDEIRRLVGKGLTVSQIARSGYDPLLVETITAATSSRPKRTEFVSLRLNRTQS